MDSAKLSLQAALEELNAQCEQGLELDPSEILNALCAIADILFRSKN